MSSDSYVQFEDYINPEKWKDLETHFRTSPAELDQNLKETIHSERSLRSKSRQYLEKQWQIKKIEDKELDEAEKLLFGNEVCAADGTYTCVSFSTTGIKGQVGVVTTSYVNKRTDYVSYFFEPLIKVSEKEFLEVLEDRKKMRDGGTAISPNQIRAIMLYMERRKVLDRKERWKLVNGDIFPHELRMGQGRLRGLKACLDLGREIFMNENIIGITANSKDYVLNTLALGLEAQEYVEIKSYRDELRGFLFFPDGSKRAHFNDSDFAMFERFIEDYADNFRVGIYKVQKRAYIFYAHKDNFDKAAAIIMRDSLFQPTRGYPLLIDYADSICTKLVAASDFNRQVSFKLAKYGGLEEEVDEHDLRRR